MRGLADDLEHRRIGVAENEKFCHDLRIMRECADSQIAVRGGWGYSPSAYPASR
jgi:hypothetical protein